MDVLPPSARGAYVLVDSFAECGLLIWVFWWYPFVCDPWDGEAWSPLGWLGDRLSVRASWEAGSHRDGPYCALLSCPLSPYT